MPNNAIEVLTAAVTPVVLVSATAILVSGMNTRYIAISDRMRALTREYRDPSSPDQRRVIISRELVTFERRIHLASWAVRALYTAVGAFILDVLIISATLWRQMLAAATLPLFLLGILLMIFAIVCQMLELQGANRTISLEIRDIAEAHKLESRN
ncbi:MAG: DUF2721 domain-containing protein [Acidobacteriaceae bacterium]|nr:DUF2721 domain-containing protein [Acidobacteriaceae bacterium]